MKHFKKVSIVLITTLLLSCTNYDMICSLNPFFLEKYVEYYPSIEGYWIADTLKSSVWNSVDTTSVWKFERVILKEYIKSSKESDSLVYKPQDKYLIKLTSGYPDSINYSFHMVLFKINNNLYGDFWPVDNSALKKSKLAFEHNFKVHTLAQVRQKGDQIHFSWLSAEKMKEMVEEKRVRAKYKWVKEPERMLLTGSSKQLVYILKRFADKKRFIDWENQSAMLQLKKVKTHESNTPEV